MDFTLAQRGRALMDFEVTARRTASALQAESESELASHGLPADALPDDMEERHRVIETALAGSGAWRLRGLLGDWCAVNHGLAAEAAFDEIADRLGPGLAELDDGQTTIDYREGFEPPRYWSSVWFHRTHGGWDGHPQNGFIHGEIVHKRYVAKVFPGDLYGTRRRVAREAPREEYDRILEIGTSSGHYTAALGDVFPKAEITGLDPSPRMLEQARRVGNERGAAWKLLVGVGEQSGLPDASFDLITAYAIHHEIPPRIVTALFEEIYRLLEPGGDFVIADVKRTWEHDRMMAWRFDWTAKWGGEPFWRPTANLDFAAMARDAGFVDVAGYGLPPSGDPYVVRGRKPA
jgi:SAM-dependent methyltransferase